MKKVLIVCTTPFSNNGISRVIKDTTMLSENKKYSFDLVIPNKEKSNRNKTLNSIDNIYEVFGRNRNPISYIFRLRKIIIHNKYDMIHIHGNSATMFFELFAAVSCGIKHRIVHAHSTFCKHHFLHRLLKPGFDALCTLRIACSEEAGKWLFKYDDYVVLRNCIETEKYRFDSDLRLKTRKKLGINNRFVIGHVGYFDYPKNQEYILKVVSKIKKQIPNALIMYIGDGPDKQKLQFMAKDLEMDQNVVFIGESNDITKYYQAFDLFLFPSFFEGFGISLLEAQMASLRILCSDSISKSIVIVEELVTFLPLNEESCVWADKIVEAYSVNCERVDRTQEFEKEGLAMNVFLSKLEKAYDEELHG